MPPPKPALIVKRPAVPPPLRIRRNVQRMASDDPFMIFYARAIVEMQKLPIDNPLSWRYQAAIHDYPRQVAPFAERRDEDPNAVEGETLPSSAQQRRFWRQCQHTSWFFLSWHRMYLHHFEKIIISHVEELGGPTNWALPYWNYGASDADGRLPIHFQNRPGAPAPLIIPQRTDNANAGNEFASAIQRNASLSSLNERSFEPVGASQGFGGPRARNHPILSTPGGTVESSPHNSMHGAIGGPPKPDPAFPGSPRGGFMNSPVTAPLDPIFWLHHCNIDRLWRVWQRAGNTETTDPRWRNETFALHDFTGVESVMKTSDVIDTTKAPLSYVYDDEPNL